MQAALNSTLGAREYFSPQQCVFLQRAQVLSPHIFQPTLSSLFLLAKERTNGVALFCEKGCVIEKVAPTNKDGLAKTRASLGF